MILKRRFSKVAIVAPSPSTDYKGAKIMKALSGKNSPVKSFFGIGGSQMSALNLKSHAQPSVGFEKPFYPIYHADVDPRFYLNLVMFAQNFKCLSVFSQFAQSQFWKEFKGDNANNVNMFVTIDCQLLAFRLHEYLEYQRKTVDGFKPLRIHIDKTVRSYTIDHLRSIDYLLYSLPVPSNDRHLFKFPSQYIGKQGVFDVLTYVYSKYPEYKELVSGTSILGDTEGLFDLVRLNKIRVNEVFRKAYSIKANDVVLFIAPGNQEGEVMRNSKAVVDGAIDFAKNLKPGQSLFVILSFATENEHTNFIHERIVEANIHSLKLVNSSNEEKYDAMSAANFGAIQNGDMQFEAMALHLPVLALDSSILLKGYFNLMYNTYSSELNWAYGGMLVPETTLWNFGTKLSEFWQLWNNNKDVAFDVIMKNARLTLRMLPTPADMAELGVEKQKEDNRFKVFMKPDFVVEQFLKQKHMQYEELKSKSNGPEVFEKKRKALIMGESEDCF